MGTESLKAGLRAGSGLSCYAPRELVGLARGIVPKGARLARWWLEVRNDSARVAVEYVKENGQGAREVAHIAI